MPRTPDRRPGPLEEPEEILLGGEAVVDPTVDGAMRYVGGNFRFKDAAGVFNPRTGGGVQLTNSPPEGIDVGDAAAVGVSTEAARADHQHALPTPPAPADVTKAAASAGVATTVARADHKHDVSTAAPGTTGVGTTSAEGVATSLARSDHVHQSNTAPINVTKAAAQIGTSGEPARADHKHDISTAAPGIGIGGGNSEGIATSLARSDHGHALRETGGPTDLTLGSVPDGYLLRRAGTSVVGVSAGVVGGLVQSVFTEVTVDVTTTSSSFVPLLSLNVTTGASYMLIWLAGSASTTNSGATIRFRVLVDGVSVGGIQIRPGATNAGQAFAFVHKTGLLTPGLHTIAVQWLTTGGTARIRPTAALDAEECGLLVQEVTV